MEDTIIPRNYGAEILLKIKSRQKELGVSTETFAQAIGMPKSTLRDIFASDGSGMKHEFVARACYFLGLTLEGNIIQTGTKSVEVVDVAEAPHDDVAKNNAQMLVERKERIDELEEINATLTEKLEQTNAQYTASLKEQHQRIEELLKRIDILTQELTKCHSDLIETHKMYAGRIDKLQEELNERHHEMTSFLKNSYNKKAED